MKQACAKGIAILMILAFVCAGVIGCGETVGGVGKDFRRIGKGVKTIFIKDTGE